MTAADARLSTQRTGANILLVFSGRLDAAGAGQVWDAAHKAARAGGAGALAFDLAGITLCDIAGATLLASVEAAHGGDPAELRGADQRVAALLERARAAAFARAAPRPPPPDVTMLHVCGAGLTALTGGVAFMGEAAIAVLRLPGRRRMLRLSDLLRYADQAGVRSLPLVALLGYLMGLILAFQSAIPLRRFGADLFVANLVAISLIRELGPLLSAVILAGRTGSASPPRSAP